MSPETGWKLAFLLAAAWITALSLSPFEFSGTSGELTARLRAAIIYQKPGGFAVGLIHFLGFAAAGVLFFNAHRSRLEAGGSWRVIMIIIVACTILEGAKLWVPTRHAMLLDLILKILGAVCGVRIAARMGLPEIHRWFPSLAALVAGISLAGWWMVGLKPIFGGVRLDWSPEFRLLVGNEDDAGRPWEGNVHELALFDRALDPREVRNWKAAEALLRYRFSGNSDSSTTPTSSLGEDPSLKMKTTAGHYLATHGPATSLTRAMAGSGAFSIAASIETGNMQQSGPARVVSLSKDWSARNFTLGQERDRLVLRVANGANGSNGLNFALEQKALEAGLREIVVNYDHGHSEMWVDGIRLPSIVDLREPWYYLPVSKENAGRGAVLVMFVICFIVPACFAIRSWMPGRFKLFPMLLLLYLPGALPFAICSISGGPWNPDPFLGLLLATAVVAPLAISYLGLVPRNFQAIR